MPANPAYTRLNGLDLARFLALTGMVIVHFDIVMASVSLQPDLFAGIAEALQGKAAATFVTLAGVGLGLAAKRSEWSALRDVTLKRSLFLLVAGLANVSIFDGDILHYYAFYFVFALLLIRAPTWLLWVAILVLVETFVWMLVVFDYEFEWDWNTLTYHGFWTIEGFIRNLFFNGWNPVVPWLSFFLLGMILSRYKLDCRRMQQRMMAIGCAVFIVMLLSSKLAIAITGPELAELLTTGAIPPMPIFVFAAGGIATAVIGACLYLADRWPRSKLIAWLLPAGRMTLTLYIVHILLGLGAVEEFGWENRTSHATAVITAIVFCSVAAVGSRLWANRWKRGPIEALMRRMTG